MHKSRAQRMHLVDKAMRLIDEKYLLHPWLGVPRMTTWLRKDKGYRINPKRIERLYGLMGLSALGPKPNTSKRGKGSQHRIYKYLLRGLKVERRNQVWAMDITYIPVQGGYLYLCVIIDLYRRYNRPPSSTAHRKYSILIKVASLLLMNSVIGSHIPIRGSGSVWMAREELLTIPGLNGSGKASNKTMYT